MVQYMALPSGLPHNVYPASSSPSEETNRLTDLSWSPNDLGYCIFQKDSTSLIANRANLSKLPSSVLATRPVGAGLSDLGPLGPSDTASPLTRCGSNRAESGRPATTVCSHADTATTATTEIKTLATRVPSTGRRSIGCRGRAGADTSYRAPGPRDKRVQPSLVYGANPKDLPARPSNPIAELGVTSILRRAAGGWSAAKAVG